MEFDLRRLLRIARAAHAYHKAHHRIEVAVTQRTDDLGIRLDIDLQAAFPEGALIFARLSSAWLGTLSAVDDVLYRDADGHFVTIGPVVGQRARFIFPTAPPAIAGPGLYNLEMSVQLVGSDPAKPVEVAHAVYKIALPEQRPCRRLAFFLPLIQLWMAVIRVDDKVLPIAIRGLKSLLGDSIPLSAQDLSDFRHIMKALILFDLAGPLQSLMLRMPMLLGIHARAPRRGGPPRRRRQRPRVRSPLAHRRPPRLPGHAPRRPHRSSDNPPPHPDPDHWTCT